MVVGLMNPLGVKAMAKKRGLPLIRIVAVAALVALVVAMGPPVWRSYSTARHISEALNGVAAAKLVVIEAATVLGGFAHVRADDLQYNAAVPSSKYISRVEVADGGLITLMTRDTGAKPDPIIVLIPRERRGHTGADVTWACQVFIGDSSQVPADCQNPTYLPAASSTAPAAEALAL